MLGQSPKFAFGGSTNGAGLLKNADGSYIYAVNHEDNFAVSRVSLNKQFKPVKGKYAYCAREIYFNVTGQNNTGANADFPRTKYGRTCRYYWMKKIL